MSVIRISSRYAKSVLDLAMEQGMLEDVANDMSHLAKAIDGNRDLELMLKSPIIHADKKQKIMEILFKDVFNKITYSFMEIIIRKGREMYLPEIGTSFLFQYNEFKKVKTASLTTATPVGDDIKELIINNILEATGSNTVELEDKVDESILGGFVLRFEDKLYDASVAHKLELLRKEFERNTYVKNI